MSRGPNKPFIKGYIYAVKCLVTGERYVGQSTIMCQLYIDSYFGSFGVFRSVKYQAKFKKDILETHITDKSELDRLEQKHIAEYRERYGLEVMWRNKSDGGPSGTGVKPTDEHRKANGDVNRGKKRSAEQCQTISNANSNSCLVDGIEYSSRKSASEQLKIRPCVITFRLNSPDFPNYIRL